VRVVDEHHTRVAARLGDLPHRRAIELG